MKDEHINITLMIVQQWGPEARTPVEERVLKAIPSLSPTEALALIKFCKKITDRAFDIVIMHTKDEISKDDAYKKLSDEFPFLTEESLSKSFSQAMYYAYHDGCFSP